MFATKLQQVLLLMDGGIFCGWFFGQTMQSIAACKPAVHLARGAVRIFTARADRQGT